MRLGEPSPVLGRVEGGGQPMLSCEQCFILCFVLFQVFVSFFCLLLWLSFARLSPVAVGGGIIIIYYDYTPSSPDPMSSMRL